MIYDECKPYDPQDGDGALDFSEFLGSKGQGRVDWVDHQHDISRTYVIDIWIFEVCGLHHRRQTTNMYGLTTYDGTLMKDSVVGAGAKKTVDPPEAAEVKVPKLSVLCGQTEKSANQLTIFCIFFSRFSLWWRKRQMHFSITFASCDLHSKMDRWMNISESRSTVEVVKLSDFIPWVDTVPLPEVDLDGVFHQKVLRWMWILLTFWRPTKRDHRPFQWLLGLQGDDIFFQVIIWKSSTFHSWLISINFVFKSVLLSQVSRNLFLFCLQIFWGTQ